LVSAKNKKKFHAFVPLTQGGQGKRRGLTANSTPLIFSRVTIYLWPYPTIISEVNIHPASTALFWLVLYQGHYSYYALDLLPWYSHA
jgi:hypothetical protein